MNRLPFSTTIRALAPFLLLAACYGQASFPEYHFKRAGDLSYVAYIPGEDALKPGKRYPLVLYLHGSCAECITHERIARESNFRFWHGYDKNVQTEPTFVIAPAGGTAGWTDSARREPVLKIVDSFVDRFPVDPRRIYIVGFSLGGLGAWDYIQHRPGFFAAANPQGIAPRQLDPAIVRRTPIWATIGAEDKPEWVSGLKEAVAQVRAANGDPRGGAPAHETGVNPRLTVFPGTNHGGVQWATQQMEGYKEWIYAQRLEAERPVQIRVQASGPEGAVVVTTAFESGPDGVRTLTGTVRNTASDTVELTRVTLRVPWIDAPGDSLLVAAGGTTMVWPAQVFSPATDQPKSSGTYLQLNRDGRYTLAAFMTWNTFWSELSFDQGELVVSVDGEGRHLRPGETLKLETIRFTESDDWQQQLYDYADEIARRLDIRLKPPRTFVGWSTWDYYARDWTAQNVIDHVHAVKAIAPASNLLQIDGGWWLNRGDYTLVRANLEAIGGMKGLAGKIKGAGLMAGIHFDGGRGDSRSRVFAAHPDYFLHDDQGKVVKQAPPGRPWGEIYFDYSHPGVVDYLTHVTRTMRRDWGYDYIKIDFLWYNLDWAIRRAVKLPPAQRIVPFDPATTSVERLHRGLRAFRQGMGDDTWLLGCSAPYGLVYGYVDSLRTGDDVFPNTHYFKLNVLANAAMFYVHERLAYNDADYQVSRSRADQDATLSRDPKKDAKDITRHEVEMWGNYVGLFSMAKLNSDNLLLLRPERREIFTQSVRLPNCSRFVPVDFWKRARTDDDAFHVMLGEAKDGLYLAIFNWNETPQTYRFAGLPDMSGAIRVAGDALAAGGAVPFTTEVAGLHSVVYRLPAGVDFDAVRKSIRLLE